jgi:hypothetical protein
LQRREWESGELSCGNWLGEIADAVSQVITRAPTKKTKRMDGENDQRCCVAAKYDRSVGGKMPSQKESIQKDCQFADEWTEEDRRAELDLIRKGRAAVLESQNYSIEKMAELLAKAQIALEIEWEAKRECVKRYLDATGRGQYGSETLEYEIGFFERLGESSIIFRHGSNDLAKSRHEEGFKNSGPDDSGPRGFRGSSEHTCGTAAE